MGAPARRRGAPAARTAELGHWREVLAGPDPALTPVPLDRTRDTAATVRDLARTLPAARTAPLLTEVPAAFHAGVDDVLLTALALAVAQWRRRRGADVRDLLLNLEGHGREDVVEADLSRTVGWFTSTYPVRLDPGDVDLADALAGGPAAGRAVKRVKEQLRAMPDRGVGYGCCATSTRTRAELAPLRWPQIGFNYLGRFAGAADDAAAWTPLGEAVAGAPDPAMPAAYALEINAVVVDRPAGPELSVTWSWPEALFAEADVAELAEGWFAALDALVTHTRAPGAGGRTPSDLLVALSQDEIDEFEAAARTVDEGPGEVLDLVGVGFGPSNLALAVALDEHNAASGRPLTARFRERQPRFGWHRGMLLDDATMQVSFLKDLVTVRNPHSPYSFVCYLHERGRLVDFINHKTLFPLRAEFHDYLEWAADRVRPAVRYDSEVVDVVPVLDGGTVRAFDVVSRGADGSTRTDRARNVALAAGLEPSLPPDARTGPRVWHNLDLLDRLAALPAPPRRVVVVGAGQSAAETVDHLHRRFPDAHVHAVFARYGFSPADDSPFANRIFDPDAVDEYHGAGAGVREMLLAYHRNTNYSVVDPELIEELYRRVYQEKVTGTRRLHVHGASRVTDVDERAAGLRVVVEHLPSGTATRLDADVLVYATGCRPVDPMRLLGAAAGLCRRDADGEPVVGRDYRIATTVPVAGGLYLSGGTERTHGITATLLSNVAMCSGDIVASLLARRAGPEPAPAPAPAHPRTPDVRVPAG